MIALLWKSNQSTNFLQQRRKHVTLKIEGTLKKIEEIFILKGFYIRVILF
jgi:hypothetical protein